jgi:hypothetical protein
MKRRGAMTNRFTIAQSGGITKTSAWVRILLLFAVWALSSPLVAWGAGEKFVDSNEYKDSNFQKCIIADYGDMVAGDGVNWVWSGVAKLDQFKVQMGKIENRSEVRSKSLSEAVLNTFRDTFNDLETGGGKGTLTADLCIYSAEHYNPAKAWIPFAGGYQMQAGIGIEMVLRNSAGKVIAKMRHYGRQGTQIEEAGQLLAGDMSRYITRH